MNKLSKLIFVVLFFCSFLQLQAQVGSMMAYGSLTYHNSKDGGYEVKANPIGLGYTFNNAVVAGLNFGLDNERDGKHNLLANKYEVGPFYSYAWSIGDHFMIIAQVDAHYQWGQSNLSGKVDAPVSFNGYLLRAYPIADVVLGNGWALKAKFAEISFSRARGKDNNHTIDQNFIAGANGSTIGLGVSKNFMLKKSRK